MKPEDKKLLLKDLCARVPYHPKGLVVNACTGAKCEEWLTCATFTMFTSVTNNCRLYLRSMSDMTEDEEAKYQDLNNYELGIFPSSVDAFDYLIERHFDYRGLIEKGLALEAPEGIYD